jgi:elongator complex protein 3
MTASKKTKAAVEYMLHELRKDGVDLEKIKRKAAVKFDVGIIKNSEVIKIASKQHVPAAVIAKLRKKPVRTISGITTVALMIKPQGSCRHKCVYCSFTGKAAKSYTGQEPAALRARGASFDPASQIKSR